MTTTAPVGHGDQAVSTRVLFGSDATTAVATPGSAWTAMRKLLPLTEDEFKGLANNTPPYLQ